MVMGKSHRKKRHGRGGRAHKGPRLDPSERLWKRMSVSKGDWWQHPWSVEDVVKHLKQLEHPSNRGVQHEEKMWKSFEQDILKLVTTGLKTRFFFQRGSQGKIFFRSPSDIEKIQNSVISWSQFFEDITLDSFCHPHVSDDSRLTMILDVWESILVQDPLPATFSIIEDEELTKWTTFDLLKAARQCAIDITGLEFRSPEPSMAYILVQCGRWDARDVMVNRLASLRKQGKNPFHSQYPQSLIQHAENLPEVDGDRAVLDGRTDLRHLDFVTIDPADAKDFDDAICLERGTTTRLWIAIADVAHYVHPKTTLDDEAYHRATSVYLPHTVLPMLPPRLADDLCSLKANVDRLAMVVCLTLDEEQHVVQTEAFEAVIHVRENLSYDDALGHPSFLEHFALAQQWQSSEVKLRLEQAEMRPRINEKGSIHIEVKWPNEATKMIESFMVAANAAVGHLLGKEGAPLPWRCHPPPDPPEVEQVNASFKALGISIELPMPSTRKHGQTAFDELADLLGSMSGGNISIEGGLVEEGKDAPPDYLQAVLDPEARNEILQSLEQAQQEATTLQSSTRRIVDHGLFQLMQRAVYSDENLGHFGLNLDAYVHFTSPIRRYADLVVHRQLKAHLQNKSWVHDQDEVFTSAQHCSERSRVAQRLEWGLVANAFHLKLLHGGTLFEHSTPYSLESTWKTRIVGMNTPWIFLDLGDEGYISSRLHFKQYNQKTQLVTDEFNLKLLTAEPNERGEHKEFLNVGHVVSCKIRGVDVWSGELDVVIQS